MMLAFLFLFQLFISGQTCAISMMVLKALHINPLKTTAISSDGVCTVSRSECSQSRGGVRSRDITAPSAALCCVRENVTALFTITISCLGPGLYSLPQITTWAGFLLPLISRVIDSVRGTL